MVRNQRIQELDILKISQKEISFKRMKTQSQMCHATYTIGLMVISGLMEEYCMVDKL